MKLKRKLVKTSLICKTVENLVSYDKFDRIMEYSEYIKGYDSKGLCNL